MTLRKFIGRILLFLLSMWFCCGPTVFAETSTPSLELIVLGSGGPGATGRAASSYLVLIEGTPRILVDAGPGSFARLGEAKLSLSETDLVLLTHLHVDHAGELPGLFKARAVSERRLHRIQCLGPRRFGRATSRRLFSVDQPLSRSLVRKTRRFRLPQ